MARLRMSYKQPVWEMFIGILKRNLGLMMSVSINKSIANPIITGAAKITRSKMKSSGNRRLRSKISSNLN